MTLFTARQSSCRSRHEFDQRQRGGGPRCLGACCSIVKSGGGEVAFLASVFVDGVPADGREKGSEKRATFSNQHMENDLFVVVQARAFVCLRRPKALDLMLFNAATKSVASIATTLPHRLHRKRGKLSQPPTPRIRQQLLQPLPSIILIQRLPFGQRGSQRPPH